MNSNPRQRIWRLRVSQEIFTYWQRFLGVRITQDICISRQTTKEIIIIVPWSIAILGIRFTYFTIINAVGTFAITFFLVPLARFFDNIFAKTRFVCLAEGSNSIIISWRCRNNKYLSLLIYLVKYLSLIHVYKIILFILFNCYCCYR